MQVLVILACLFFFVFLPCLVCYRFGRFMDRSHIRGIDCTGVGCDTCERLASDRKAAQWNNAVMDHAMGKTCPHTFTATRRVLLAGATGRMYPKRQDVCLVCDKLV